MKMSKEEIYRSMCIEAGTYTGGAMTAAEWYVECSHNINDDLNETLILAADGDTYAISQARIQCGLPAFR